MQWRERARRYEIRALDWPPVGHGRCFARQDRSASGGLWLADNVRIPRRRVETTMRASLPGAGTARRRRYSVLVTLSSNVTDFGVPLEDASYERLLPGGIRAAVVPE